MFCFRLWILPGSLPPSGSGPSGTLRSCTASPTSPWSTWVRCSAQPRRTRSRVQVIVSSGSSISSAQSLSWATWPLFWDVINDDEIWLKKLPKKITETNFQFSKTEWASFCQMRERSSFYDGELKETPVVAQRKMKTKVAKSK